MRLILVRHGESVGNSEGRLQGQTDYGLTPKGERQSALTGDRLAAEGVAALFTSPLLRAYATARVIGERLSLPPIELPGVREYDFGKLAGRTYADIREHFAAMERDVGGGPVERAYPGEEGRDAFYKRVTQSTWEVVDRHRDATVVIVSHGGPIALFCQSALGLQYKRPMPFAIDNCSLTVFQVRDEPDGRWPRAVLLSLNDTCHLALPAPGRDPLSPAG